MKESFIKLKERIYKIKLQLKVLEIYGSEYIIANSNGEEQHVVFDIEQMYKRHEYHANRLIYHAENFIRSWENYKAKHFENQKSREYFTTWFDDSIYYEFDSFIATSSSIFEEPFKKDAQECFNKKTFKEFEDIFPNKSTPESLLWRLTIMRNRIVHPDHPTSLKDGYRNMEFKSKLGNMVKIKDNELIEIPSNLIDIENHNQLKKILNEEVIEKTKKIRANFKSRVCETNCAPILPDFHSIIFNSSKKVQKGAKMMISSGTNLLESFISICNQILDYLSKLHSLYFKNYSIFFGKSFDAKRIFFVDINKRIIGWGKLNDLEKREHIKLDEIFNYT